jgi:hypothetical protein
MKKDDLEKRIQKLEDIEAIKKLKFDYAEGCDLVANEKHLDPLLKVFTEDAVWDGGAFGKYIGKKAIKEFLNGIPTMLTYSMHYFSNPRISVDENQAQGRWYLLAFFTDVEGNDLILIGIEDDEYKKADGQWLISSMTLTTHSQAPLAEGWHKAVVEKFGSN